jgi:uncharacterized membrane protein
MSTDVQVETLIRRPRREVSSYAMDWRNDRSWIRALTGARLLTPEPFGIGSRVARSASFLGREIEYVNEIVELEPERRLVMRSVQAPFPMTIVYEFEDADDGTRVRIRTLGDASGFYRLPAPVLARAVKRALTGDLRQLRDVLER